MYTRKERGRKAGKPSYVTCLTTRALLSVCGGETMEGPMMGIKAAGQVRRSLAVRAGVAVVVAVVVAAGLALAGAVVASAASAQGRSGDT